MKKLKISEAKSYPDCIALNSKRHRNFVAVGKITKEGEIIAKYMTKKQFEATRSDFTEFLNYFTKLFPVIIIYALICDKIHKIDTLLAYRVQYLGAALFLLIEFYIISKKTRKNVKFFKMHAAEHMVIHAFEDLQRIPSIAELRTYSRFDNSCGTNIFVSLLSIFLLFFFSTFFTNFIYFLIFLIINLVIFSILLFTGKLNYLQNFTTLPPTDTELEVALAALNVWYEYENKIRRKKRRIKKL